MKTLLLTYLFIVISVLCSAQGEHSTLKEFELLGKVNKFTTTQTDKYGEQKREFTFDKNGLVTEVVLYSKNEKYARGLYKYNTAKKLVEVLTYNKSDEKDYLTTYVYNDKGFLTQEKRTSFAIYNAYSDIIRIYKRDSKGNILEKMNKDPKDNKVTYKESFGYDAKGNQVFEKYSNYIKKRKYTYDNKGKITETTETFKDNEASIDSNWYITKYIYNDKEKLIRKEETQYYKNFNNTAKIKTLYDDNFNIVDYSEYGGLKIISKKYTYKEERDSNGNLIKKTINEDYVSYPSYNSADRTIANTIIVTMFDLTGNMIKKQTQKDGKVIENIERTITYF